MDTLSDDRGGSGPHCRAVEPGAGYALPYPGTPTCRHPKPDLTDEERRYYARVEARASRLVAELRERAAAGEDLPTEGAFLIRVRQLVEAIGDADDITIGKRDVALFAELAATMALETAAESIADEPATPRPGTLH